MSETTCEEAGLPGLKWPINFRELMLLMHTNKILAGNVETVVGDEFYGELIVVCGVSIDPKVQFGQPQVSGVLTENIYATWLAEYDETNTFASIETVAKWYSITACEVRNAIKFEQLLRDGYER